MKKKKIEQPIVKAEKPEIKEVNNLPQVKKTFGKRAMMLSIFGGLAFIGIILLLVYVLSGNNLFYGFMAIPLLFTGGLGFYYYWNQSKDLQVRYVGEVPTGQVNSLTIYPDKVIFENINDPEGFVWHWIDDGKPYYLNWWNPTIKRIEPYKLPDQQYYDPEVFAQRVLMLPCHRKIFARRQDILNKLKPVFAGLVGVGLWILILTTTAPKG
jgi:hypothetical protein